MVPEVKRSLVAALVLVSLTVAAQAPDATSDHWTPEEASAPFGWGAQCTFSDGIGIVFRSNWQKRHWIKIAGNQVEFNGETEMSEPGWYQTFAGSDFTVTLRLRRILPELRGSDGVRLIGEIEITRSGQSTQYQVTGSCGA
jgi:hypothetical protein